MINRFFLGVWAPPPRLTAPLGITGAGLFCCRGDIHCAVNNERYLFANLGPFLGPLAVRSAYGAAKPLISLVGVAGFEPATPSSRTRCALPEAPRSLTRLFGNVVA
jgi:hypothetical protein